MRLNATTGAVLGWIDARGLLSKQRSSVRYSPQNYVLNGIAYHSLSRRLYVTGKNWDHMYQIRIKPEPTKGPDFIKSICNLG